MRILSVSDVTKYIKQIIESDVSLMSIAIRGEVSNFKRHYSGHCYFSLKDSEAVIKVVMFKSRAQFLKFEPRDGLKVIACGRVSVFERDGQYQLYVEQLLPDGVGELSLAYAQLKEKLTAEGLFDEIHKKPIPLMPRTVGIVTSPTGAAIRDIITVSKRRYPGVSLILYPVQVQGTDAPCQIVKAIKAFNSQRPVDVIIVGRGGGSLEELWAFNDEQVVRAIAASTIPIVSAVGHETDYTLADFVADRRAATPSQAAEMVTPDIKELERYLKTLRNMLEVNTRNLLRNKRKQLEEYKSSRIFRNPEEMLLSRQQMVDMYIQRLQGAFKEIFISKQHRFKLAVEKLALLNPLAVLARGYSIVRTAEGHVVCNAGDIKGGQSLEIILHKGTINVEVLNTKEGTHGEA